MAAAASNSSGEMLIATLVIAAFTLGGTLLTLYLLAGGRFGRRRR